eukprot:TRINITY_DN27595_c0_g1_i1.p1 TRINITY_DN27595_c0_g1~~TRINITY_DN27595_c0_g1_i1.p1  ORF type:complete len:243 (+),score=27.11 TRINITY_DN27595_c0_g1_i1:63-791(+)
MCIRDRSGRIRLMQNKANEIQGLQSAPYQQENSKERCKEDEKYSEGTRVTKMNQTIKALAQPFMQANATLTEYERKNLEVTLEYLCIVMSAQENKGRDSIKHLVNTTNSTFRSSSCTDVKTVLEYADGLRKFLNSFTTLNAQSMNALIAKGNRVVVSINLEGVFDGLPYCGVPATFMQGAYSVIYIFELNTDSQIVSIIREGDLSTFFRQVGLSDHMIKKIQYLPNITHDQVDIGPSPIQGQ